MSPFQLSSGYVNGPDRYGFVKDQPIDWVDPGGLAAASTQPATAPTPQRNPNQDSNDAQANNGVNCTAWAMNCPGVNGTNWADQLDLSSGALDKLLAQGPAAVKKYVESQMFKNNKWGLKLSNPDKCGNCPPGSHKVRLYIYTARTPTDWGIRDFHWTTQDDDGRWSEKGGPTNKRNRMLLSGTLKTFVGEWCVNTPPRSADLGKGDPAGMNNLGDIFYGPNHDNPAPVIP